MEAEILVTDDSADSVAEQQTCATILWSRSFLVVVY
jgi:hypothetical protein